MKFSKDLSQDLVPEWRVKYLDYKVGKKKVKAVARALQRLNHTPRTPRIANVPSRPKLQRWIFGDDTPPSLSPQANDEGLTETYWDRRTYNETVNNTAANSGSANVSEATKARTRTRGRDSLQSSIDAALNPEERPLQGSPGTAQSSPSRVRNYGSILSNPASTAVPIGPPSLELPDPALSPSQTPSSRHDQLALASEDHPPLRRVSTQAGDAYEVGRTHTPSKMASTLLPKHRNMLRPRRTFSTPLGGVPRRSPLKRMFSLSGEQDDGAASPDVPLESYREFDVKQADFFAFLDKELQKIESFYVAKENEAEQRLQVLRDQLHIMRDSRVRELVDAQRSGNGGVGKQNSRTDGATNEDAQSVKVSNAPRWVREIEDAVGIGSHRFGKNSAALSRMVEDAQIQRASSQQLHANRRDFARKPQSEDVSYRTAKRKLKMALQEFYRGLELLKSYALLNRIAFRKINKKYDKAVQARPPMRYMSDKVNKAWFVQSEKLEMLLVGVEDLYARYFERGNHKVAVGKLRSRSDRHSYSGSVFRNGVFLAAGIVFGFEGLVDAVKHLNNADSTVALQTSYLLQLYGGYFLVLFLVLFFVIDCRIWVRSKINYVFIFEFDSRSSLDWRQLGELPSICMLLLGLCLWLNFQQSGPGPLFIYWPIILVVTTAMLLFVPLKVLYHRSRGWFLYSNFRLLLAGAFPVEFRDFFLGDMFCSLTYAMGNIEVFFCLYSHDWQYPTQCNSSHSRVLGFLTTVPGIWRALQCLRRFHDTRNAFPHLVNFGKYTATCIFYMTLSIYRMSRNDEHRIIFIFFAILNSIYTSVWDLVMDWSLGNPYAKNAFLRDVLGYKRVWWYYLAMIVDPILRFNWLLYVGLSEDLQHSAVLSFLISFSEVCRRGVWTIFRVENEHCTNVGRFRASRDVPLPYETCAPDCEPILDDSNESISNNSPQTHRSAVVSTRAEDVEHGVPTTYPEISPQLRRRRTLPASVEGTPSTFGRGLQRVGTIIAAAHAQDFERKRRPGIAPSDGKREQVYGDSSDDDEDDDPPAENETDREDRREVDEENEAESILQRHQSATTPAS